MTTATRSVAVVATRLPITDRRALSQAWFTALHLATTPRPATAGARATLSQGRGTLAPARVAGGTPHAPLSSPPRLHAGQSAPSTATPFERRAPAGELARRIERAIARHAVAAAPRPVAIAIDAGEGRVQLLVRTDGSTTRVIALCAPHVRERVDRALAQARFALAAGGTRVEGAR